MSFSLVTCAELEEDSLCVYVPPESPGLQHGVLGSCPSAAPLLIVSEQCLFAVG